MQVTQMKQILTSVTQRGQVTIPAEVRKMLGIKPRDKVIFIIDEDRVGLAPARFTIETVFGSVKPSTKTEDFASIEKEAKEEKAEEEIRRLPKV